MMTTTKICKRKIVIVGLCCKDIVNYLDGFPEEDSDNRVYEQVKISNVSIRVPNSVFG